mgnify:CR=1 FL=1
MLNNFIYAKSKNSFLNELNTGNVSDEAIVFIADTKEIWNNGTYFNGNNTEITLPKPYVFTIVQDNESYILDSEEFPSPDIFFSYPTALETEDGLINFGTLFVLPNGD